MSLADQIVNWMQRQVKRAGSAGITVGLSGGVDSACVAALAQKATPGAVTGALIPCHSDPLDLEHGQLVADTYGIETVTVDLTAIYDSLLAALPTPPEGQAVAGDRRMAEANLKPRLRMTTLYYIANLHNYLVAGTGNKSEVLVGYFTKYGDGGSDMLPLGDLYKREVYRLARDLDVPQPILERPPSAGLWVGQTDEEEMGLSYDMLERALITLSIGGDHGVPQPTLMRVRQMMQDSEHKRALPPVFVRGSS